MLTIDSSNTLFTLAAELVNLTSRHIFLTGRAGTGKTTFLKYIRENCPKQIAIVAPTGVAAINANGVTIHSFFQLPFSPFVPDSVGLGQANDEITNRHTLLSRLRINSERRKVIQELELLIIDEISMVRCDVLDAIDLVLRHIRHRHLERFGGVQLLFIGDMFQLPPVVKETEWRLLKEYYESPYFFDSLVMKGEPPVYLEFTKIYRQTEHRFISLLNQVRNNAINEEGLRILQERYQPDFFGERSEGYILLTTHNETARKINANELEKLAGKLYTYKAKVEDEFPSTAYPAEELLQLKIGAQVMFIKNDTEKNRRYFNGKIGMITELDENKITVHCKNEADAIEVKMEKWENIRYTVNKANRQLEEDVLGAFSQYPLRLAWAITIHKSQGLTFEKAVIDAGEAFAPGQAYVALSRCTNLDGMVLHSRFNPNRLYTDNRIVRFSNTALQLDSLRQELFRAKKNYQEKVLTGLFDFKRVISGISELKSYLLDHRSSFNPDVFSWCDSLKERTTTLQSTAEKFHMQLVRLFPQTERVEDNSELHKRTAAATDYFAIEIRKLIDHILQSPAVTDSRLHAKEYNDGLREIFMQFSRQVYLMQGFGGRFDIEGFHQRKNSFTAPVFPLNAYAGMAEKKTDLPHPVLYNQLRKMRDEICSKKEVPIYLVAGSKTLEEMTIYLPQTLEEMEQISGFGKAKLEAYGNRFLSVIQEYCNKQQLSSNIGSKDQKRKRRESRTTKVDTKAESFRLYREGKSVNEIAEVRKLTGQTIECHLAHYVQNGQIRIDELVNREKIVLIEPILKAHPNESLTSFKEKLGTQASFAEIRLVLASLEYRKLLPAHENH